MSVATSIPKTAPRGRSHSFVLVAALAAVVALTAWGIATYAVGHEARPTSRGIPTEASVLSGLKPQQRQYVLGIVALTPAQSRATFGTDPVSGDKPRTRSLTAGERRYVRAIASMSSSELAAAFGPGR